jgi:chaperonin cofactor prefoldin
VPAWAVVLTAAVSAFVTYLGLVRRSSGKISTTDADVLWKVMQTHVEALTARITKLEEDNSRLRTENRELQRRLDRVENGDVHA